MLPSLEGAFACKCLKCPSPLLVSGFGISYKIIIQLKGLILILPIFLDPGHCPNAPGDLIVTVFPTKICSKQFEKVAANRCFPSVVVHPKSLVAVVVNSSRVMGHGRLARRLAHVMNSSVVSAVMVWVTFLSGRSLF